mmetsp:Transcript_12555/g.34323  ORF Transcript_12555/g.34323 Transcript_12555/m.34323 type:complete len:457 (-) Transcript_12555:138-1508(-)
MASKYAKRLVVPDEFPEVLKSFTRELLRDLPADVEDGTAVEEWILEYGRTYFENRADVERSSGGGGSDFVDAAAHMSPEELRERITAIFLDADVDNNGFLDHREFKEVLRRFGTDLGLQVTDMRRLMAEADENADGCIEYHEFVPLAVDVIDTAIAKRRFEESKMEREADAVARSRQFLLHGMSREDLESVLQDMFRQADTDGSGGLSRSEFVGCLRNSGLGLTRKEINVLLAEVDEDADGMVTYEEFLPLCFNLLVEIVSQEFEAASVPTGESELREFFLAVFHQADPEDTGRLRPYELQDLIRQADLGLTTVQISALMSEAVVDEDGLVRYEAFANDVASVIASIIDVQMSQEKAEKLAELRASNETVNGMTRDMFEGTVEAAMSPAADGGRVHVDDARLLLTSDAVGLSNKEAQAIISLSSPDESMTVEVRVLASKAFDVLQSIKEHEAMSGW